jgi:hypothetical protein
MSTNFATLLRNNLTVLCLMLMLSAPLMAISAAKPACDSTQISVTDDSEQRNIFVIKAKDKSNEIVEINRNFYTGLGIDLATIALIILLIYYPNYKKLDTIFTFVMFNIIIFLLTFVLNKVKLSMGAAFGLFAIFSMLRYRTSNISVKDMTYLFIFIAIGLLSGIQMNMLEQGLVCLVIFVTTFLLDTHLLLKRDSSKNIVFEQVEMAMPNKREALIHELQQRTGLNIHRVVVNDLDYMKDVAYLTIYYYEQ